MLINQLSNYTTAHAYYCFVYFIMHVIMYMFCWMYVLYFGILDLKKKLFYTDSIYYYVQHKYLIHHSLLDHLYILATAEANLLYNLLYIN